MPDQYPSSVRLDADGVVGGSGKPIVVYSVEFLSGGSAGTLVLRNGTADTDTIYVQTDGTASKTARVSWPQGLRFPDGCFFDKDANVTAAVVNFKTVGG